MKYFRFHLRSNIKLLLYVIVFSLCMDLIVFASVLPNADVQGYLKPVIISFGITVISVLIWLFLIYCLSKKNEPLFDVLNEKGVCDELITVYRQRHPRMNPINHVVLGMYLKSMGRFEEAEYELSFAGNSYMADVNAKAYYSEALINLRIYQKRFDEAIMLYNNYSSMMNVYCRRSIRNPSVCMMHYANGALLYAYSGDFNSAMICIKDMEKIISKQRKYAFTRNTALMGVYLIKGDYRSADNIKSLMLKDLEGYDGFDMKYEAQAAFKDINDVANLFDPRMPRL